MKKFVLIVTTLLVTQFAFANDTLSVVPLFRLDIESVYNVWYDSAQNEINFQSSDGRITKTDFAGNILSVESCSYEFFTKLEDDTIYIDAGVILSTSGDTIQDMTSVFGVIFTEDDNGDSVIIVDPDHSLRYITYCNGNFYSHHDCGNLSYGNRIVMAYPEANWEHWFRNTMPISGLTSVGKHLYWIDKSHDGLLCSIICNNSEKRSDWTIQKINATDCVGLFYYQDSFYTYLSERMEFVRLVETSAGETTGVINNIIIDKNSYDLFGRRVENPQSGLYIKDGKKIFIK